MSEEEWIKQKDTLRNAQTADKFVVSKWIPVEFPFVEPDVEATTMNVVWSTKGPLEVELLQKNIAYIIRAIAASPPAEKPSPKRKRRRLRRNLSELSAPGDEDAEQEQEEQQDQQNSVE